jgi:hypothetical protein
MRIGGGIGVAGRCRHWPPDIPRNEICCAVAHLLFSRWKTSNFYVTIIGVSATTLGCAMNHTSGLNYCWEKFVIKRVEVPNV